MTQNPRATTKDYQSWLFKENCIAKNTTQNQKTDKLRKISATYITSKYIYKELLTTERQIKLREKGKRNEQTLPKKGVKMASDHIQSV